MLVLAIYMEGRKLDDSGRLKDAELLKRLHKQVVGFVEFVERLKQLKLRG